MEIGRGLRNKSRIEKISHTTIIKLHFYYIYYIINTIRMQLQSNNSITCSFYCHFNEILSGIGFYLSLGSGKEVTAVRMLKA